MKVLVASEILFLLLGITFLFSRFSCVSDISLIAFICLLPESLVRLLHNKKMKEFRLVNILNLRETKIDKEKKITSPKDAKDLQESILSLIENSLSLIGILIAIVFALFILPFTTCMFQDEGSKATFIMSTFITFFLLGSNLVLCYSSMAFKADIQFLKRVLTKYYNLMLLSVYGLSVTIIYGVYSSYLYGLSLIYKILITLVWLVFAFSIYCYLYIFKEKNK